MCDQEYGFGKKERCFHSNIRIRIHSHRKSDRETVRQKLTFYCAIASFGRQPVIAVTYFMFSINSQQSNGNVQISARQSIGSIQSVTFWNKRSQHYKSPSSWPSSCISFHFVELKVNKIFDVFSSS